MAIGMPNCRINCPPGARPGGFGADHSQRDDGRPTESFQAMTVSDLSLAVKAWAGNTTVASKNKIAARPRNEEWKGSQVWSDVRAKRVFAGGSRINSPRMDSASAREAAELAMSLAPSRCQRPSKARACSSTLVTNVMSTISLRSPSVDEAVRQSWSSRHAPSRFKCPANSNRKAVGPSCM
jgi:hypothetical protein